MCRNHASSALDSATFACSILAATRKTDFHDKWMSAERWTDLVAHNYQLLQSINHDRKQLPKAVNLDRRSTAINNASNEAIEHTNVFRKWCKPESGYF
jgi:hypothetical protein